MVVLNEEKLSLLFDEISRGFVKSPVEIAFFIVLVIGALLFFIFISRHQAKKRVIAVALQAQELLLRLSKKKALNNLEVALLRKMAAHLKSSGEIHLLFDSQAVFNVCVEKLLKEEQVSHSLISGLRLKLGFEKGNRVHSTTELTEDRPVLMFEKKSRKRVPGLILKNDPRALFIEVEKPPTGQKVGTPIQVYFQNQSGLYTFTSRIIKAEKGVMLIVHSENIRRIQRRKFYRRKISMPVYVHRDDDTAMPAHTLCTDLGGGGASIINPDRHFKPGDRLELHFRLAEKRKTQKQQRIHATGEVVRLSEGGRKAHILFDALPEAVRDRIIRFLFAKERKK
jgi:c-di-GMP-binding flagellar brake protein YcgR